MFARDIIFAVCRPQTGSPKVLYEGCRKLMLHSFTLHNKRFRITLTDGFYAWSDPHRARRA
jgi:hypothetical protein